MYTLSRMLFAYFVQNLIKQYKRKYSALCCVWCLVAQLCVTLCNHMDCSLPSSSVLGDSAGKNTGVGCHALLQGIFLTQGSNAGLSRCRQILYQVSHQGNPRILEWVLYTLMQGIFPTPGIELGFPALQVDSSPAEVPQKPIQL